MDWRRDGTIMPVTNQTYLAYPPFPFPLLSINFSKRTRLAIGRGKSERERFGRKFDSDRNRSRDGGKEDGGGREREKGGRFGLQGHVVVVVQRHYRSSPRRSIFRIAWK